MHTFSPTGFISEGWEIFKRRPWFFIGLAFAFAILSYLPGSILNAIIPPPSETATTVEMYSYYTATWPYQLLLWLFGMFLNMLVLEVAISAQHNPERVRMHSIFDVKVLASFLAAQILVGIIVGLGTLLLIIPGIMLSLALFFTGYVVVDKKMGPIAAMRESMRITSGFKWHLAVFGMLAVLVNLLGALILGVGLLVTVPVTLLALASIYRALESGRLTPTPLSSGEKVAAAVLILLPVAFVAFIVLIILGTSASADPSVPALLATTTTQ